MKKRIAALLAIYALAIVLTSLLWPMPWILSGCLLLIGAAMLYRWHGKADLLSYAVAFFLGPIGEAVAVRAGAWAYARPVLLVPAWLPPLWGIAGLFLRRVCESVNQQKR
jgi:hypothetical protein